MPPKQCYFNKMMVDSRHIQLFFHHLYEQEQLSLSCCGIWRIRREHRENTHRAKERGERRQVDWATTKRAKDVGGAQKVSKVVEYMREIRWDTSRCPRLAWQDVQRVDRSQSAEREWQYVHTLDR